MNVLRSLLKSPGYASVAILIVALGVGAATAIFSAVNGVILRPFALPDPDRLVAVYETNLSRNLTIFAVSAPNYADWRERSHSWQSLAALEWRTMNLTGQGEPETIAVRAVTANFLPTFGLAPTLGRNFLDEEDRLAPAASRLSATPSGTTTSPPPRTSSAAPCSSTTHLTPSLASRLPAHRCRAIPR